MQEQMRTFGYICPACGKSVIESRSVFALTAAAAVIGCECGKSELLVETDGLRCRLHVPCGVCGETHRAECDAKALLEGEGVGFACPATKQLCCYAGEDARVHRAMRELELTAVKEKKAAEEPEAFADNVIMYEVLSELKEIAARPGGITCACGAARYGMEVRSTFVDLVCRDCGAKLRIPAATDEDLDQLCCHLKLQIGGKQ